MLAIVAPGQGAQKPGFLSDWMSDPTFSDHLAWLSAVADIDLVTHGTTSDEATIKDTAVAQPLLVAAAILVVLVVTRESVPAWLAAVGVVALVAVVYAASSPDEVEAQCVDPQGVVVPDENCGGTQQGGYYNSSGVFVPIFIGGFGNQYHYNYGSSSPVGTVAQGGTTAPPPSGTSVRSGTTGSSLGSTSSSGTVSRGGLGVGGSSSGTSGSSGSSGSSSGSSGSSSGS